MKHLYFVRHGLTHANVARIWSGTTETTLTDEGKQQAKRAGQHAAKLRIDLIVSSPLGRTRETAEHIAREIGYPLEKIEYNSLLLERHFGAMEGQTWQADHDADGFIDVETKEAVLERAKLAMEYVKSLEADNILVVSHGTFGRAFRSLTHPHLPFESRGNERTKFKNAEIVQLI
jgi:probable phosphoglycerate mutase